VSEQTLATTEPAPATSGGRPAGSALAPLVAGAVMVAVGVLLLTQVFAIKADGFDPQGPRFFPLVVLTLLTGLSVVYLLQQVLAIVRGSGLLPAEPFTHMPAAAALVGLLVGYAFVLAPLGYVITTSLFFVGAARTMGSRHLSRDIAVGVGLSLLVYLSFTQALGVSLPAGVLPL
jgi:putative tricarboxylic transport membrane protein